VKSYAVLVFVVVTVWLVAGLRDWTEPVYTEQVHLTKGPGPEYVNVAWQLKLIEQRREQETTMPYLLGLQLQAPIHVDGSIPLWGMLVFLTGLVATGVGTILAMQRKTASLEFKMDAHDKMDRVQFDNMSESMAVAHEENVRRFDEIMRRLDKM
jgi:hypothetical protein